MRAKTPPLPHGPRQDTRLCPRYRQTGTDDEARAVRPHLHMSGALGTDPPASPPLEQPRFVGRFLREADLCAVCRETRVARSSTHLNHMRFSHRGQCF